MSFLCMHELSVLVDYIHEILIRHVVDRTNLMCVFKIVPGETMMNWLRLFVVVYKHVTEMSACK